MSVGLEELCFIALVFLFVCFIIKNATDFYDITIVGGEYILIKNLFKKTEIHSTQSVHVGKGILPFVFYLQQATNRYYFFLGTSLLLPSIFTLEPEKALILLKNKLDNIKSNSV